MAAGSEMVAPALLPIDRPLVVTVPDCSVSCAFVPVWPFGGAAPEIVEHDIHACFELAAEGGDEGIAVLVEGDDGVGAEAR